MAEQPRTPGATPILSAAARLAETAETVSAQFARELARVLRDAETALRPLVRRALEGDRTAQAVVARAGVLRRELRDVLTEAGYDDLAQTATSAGLDRVLARVNQLRLAARAARVTTADAARVQALQELARLDLLGVGDETAAALWRTLAQGIYTQRDYGDLLEDLATALDREAHAVRTLYDTTVSMFARQVEALKATGDGDEAFLFAGPVGGPIRPFCAERVGKVYTRDEIGKMDNGQLPNVFLTGGGYNCRHTWVAVSRVSELRDLVGTGERVPEVAEAIARAPKPKRQARQAA